MSARYAIYFSPDDESDLATYGECVLGRNADGTSIGVSDNRYPVPAIAHELSATPAHYGFHATLKAPFYLAQGVGESKLLEAVEALANSQSAASMDTLSPRLMSGFMALSFSSQPPAIAKIAEHCVTSLEPLRAALSEEDIARRNPDALNDIQRQYLMQYGYPYVLSEFRFHMTLTGKLNTIEQSDYIAWLEQLYTKLVPEVPVLDRLAVYWQADKHQVFTRLAQFPFN